MEHKIWKNFLKWNSNVLEKSRWVTMIYTSLIRHGDSICILILLNFVLAHLTYWNSPNYQWSRTHNLPICYTQTEKCNFFEKIMYTSFSPSASSPMRKIYNGCNTTCIEPFSNTIGHTVRPNAQLSSQTG